MASRAKIVANDRRRRIVARHAERRAELKARARTAQSLQERMAAQRALAKLPRDASPVRVRNRGASDGRPRGFLRVAGLSRNAFRAQAHAGNLPGIRTSSW